MKGPYVAHLEKRHNEKGGGLIKHQKRWIEIRTKSDEVWSTVSELEMSAKLTYWEVVILGVSSSGGG